jgi:hypothetical protein
MGGYGLFNRLVVQGITGIAAACCGEAFPDIDKAVQMT